MGLKIFGLEIKKASTEQQIQQQVNYQLTNFLTQYSQYFTATPQPITDGVDAFATVTDIYSIIQYISSKFSTVPVYVYEVKDKEEYKKYKRHLKNKNIKEALKVRTKAMDEQKTSNALSEILKRPNLQQSQDSFFQQVMGYRLSGGAAPIWKNRGNSGKEPIAMHVLLPSKLEFKPSAANPFYRERFQFDETGVDLRGDMNDLLYWSYWTPKFDSHNFTHLYGFSPLQAAAYTMSANQAAQKAALATFENKGVNGVMFPNVGNEVIPQPQRDKMREDLNRYANNKENRGGIFLSGAPLGYIDVGMTAGEMELIKAMNLTKQNLCNVFQFPFALFDGQTTFNNVQQAGKQLITNKIMPEWTSFADQLNLELTTEFTNGAKALYVIEPDFSDMYEMQEDVKFLVDTMTPLFDRGVINGNELREVLEYEQTDLPEHNTYFINSNYQPIGEAAMPIINDEQGMA